VLQALVRLLRDGHDVTRMSIDTLAASDVTGAKAEAGLPVSRVRVLPYRPGLSSDDVVAFHRRQRRGSDGTSVAVTCLRPAYEVLRDELPTFRLAPSTHSVRV